GSAGTRSPSSSIHASVVHALMLARTHAMVQSSGESLGHAALSCARVAAISMNRAGERRTLTFRSQPAGAAVAPDALCAQLAGAGSPSSTSPEGAPAAAGRTT